MPQADPARLAALLGFELEEAPAPSPSPSQGPADPVAPARAPAPSLPARTWVLVSREYAEPPSEAPPPAPVDTSPLDEAGDAAALPPTPPAVPWNRLEARLRRAMSAGQRGRELDLPLAVEHLARGQGLHPVPRRPRAAWPARLHLWLDGNRRLLPLWPDMGMVARSLSGVLPRGELRLRLLDGELPPAEELPPAGSALLVLSDLHDERRWLAVGRALRRAGVEPVVLVPRALPLPLRQVFRVLPWDAAARVRDRSTALDRLLVCCAPARVLHPGLLRAIRLLLPAGEADLGTELALWADPRLGGCGGSGAVLDGALCASLRARFAREVEGGLQERIRDTVERWHQAMPPELRHAETLGWLHTPGLAGRPPGDPDRARAWLRALRGAGEQPGGDPVLALVDKGLVGALPEEALRRDEDLGAIYRRVAAKEREGRVRLPEGELLPPGSTGTPLALRLVGDRLRLEPSPRAEDPGLVPLRPGSPLARVRAGSHVAVGGVRRRIGQGLDLALPRQDRLELDLGPERLVLERQEAPAWAKRWGRDRYGLWAEAEWKGVGQRFRWIPPGRFVMGSPEDEVGRLDREVQHPVRLTQGYWMGETPVTQALWTAVMGKNPSHFKGERHPVEQVSWDTVMAFLDRLDNDVHLPTEAEWEHACRAGSEGPPWAGAGTEDVLARVAWFNKNSGDSTHPVGEKAANPWGLYDMLGNVLEWCVDGWQESLTGAATDPWKLKASNRVSRGGAWFFSARFCRAAYRFARHPSDGWGYLGFRLARGPALQARKQALRRLGSVRSGAREEYGV